MSTETATQAPATRAKNLPMKAALAVLGVSRPYAYSLMQKGLLPRPVKWGSKLALFPEDELYAVVNARTRGASEDEIRQLVSDLMLARKTRF